MKKAKGLKYDVIDQLPPGQVAPVQDTLHGVSVAIQHIINDYYIIVQSTQIILKCNDMLHNNTHTCMQISLSISLVGGLWLPADNWFCINDLHQFLTFHSIHCASSQQLSFPPF